MVCVVAMVLLGGWWLSQMVTMEVFSHLIGMI